VNWLDCVIGFILIASVAAGVRKGFARAAIGIVALLIAAFAGLWTYGLAGGWLREYVSHPSVADFAGFCIVFFAVTAAGVLAGHLLAKLFKWVGLGWLDRLMGAALGILRATLFAMVLILALCSFSRNPPPASVANSKLAPYIIDASSLMVAVAPRELRAGFEESYRKIKKMWQEMFKKTKPLPVEQL
jgi:membrane protein required for colicin V production